MIPELFSAFDVFLVRQFFLNFPRELEEAARLDGLDHLWVFRRIVTPNTPAFAAALLSLVPVPVVVVVLQRRLVRGVAETGLGGT